MKASGHSSQLFHVELHFGLPQLNLLVNHSNASWTAGWKAVPDLMVGHNSPVRFCTRAGPSMLGGYSLKMRQ